MTDPAFYRKFIKPFNAADLRDAREEQVRACKEAGLSDIMAWDLAAVADELACNIIEHSDATWLEWDMRAEGYEKAVLVLRDNGVRFDAARASAAADQMAGDGTHRHMGLLLVRRTVQSMDYNRLPDGTNELTLRTGPPARRTVPA